jgi:hypothetical protein
VLDGGVRRQVRFQAGYQVTARYPDEPGSDDFLLVSAFPLTDRGLRDAIDFAR